MAKEKLNWDDEQVRHSYRHTASHIMAQAIKRLWPDTKLAIGPAIDNGFYYDFDSEHKFAEEDFMKIQKEMKKIVQANYPLERFVLPRAEAIKYMEERNEPYKVELIEDLPEDEEISFYKQGEFVDLCAGPHMESTGKIKAFKLMSVAGAYWRGDSDRQMLQRIYATAFPTQEELDEYIAKLEEAKKRDHRKIGKEMDLFMLTDEGPGFPFFLPKGMIIRNELEAFWRQEHIKRGYEEIKTPLILNEQLWRNLRSLGPLQRQHVFHQDRRRRLRRKADELPWLHAGVQTQAVVIQGISYSLRRAGTSAQTRAFRRASRPHESEDLYSGRRSHIHAS